MTAEEKHLSYKDDTLKDAFWSDDALSTKYHHYLKEKNIANGLQVSAGYRKAWNAAKNPWSKEYKEARRKHHDAPTA